MSKDPAFLFYPGDWMGGVSTFTRTHKGAYMDLLMAQHNNGHLSIEDIEIVLGSDFEKMWEQKLKSKFTEDDNGLFYNKKLEEVITKRKAFSKSRKDNLESKKSHKDDHMKPHMENENINRIELREEIFKKAVKDFNSPHEKDFIDYWTEPNKSGTKMRFEMEKTWDLKRRLSRWSSNDFGKKEDKETGSGIPMTQAEVKAYFDKHGVYPKTR